MGGRIIAVRLIASLNVSEHVRIGREFEFSDRIGGTGMGLLCRFQHFKALEIDGLTFALL